MKNELLFRYFFYFDDNVINKFFHSVLSDKNKEKRIKKINIYKNFIVKRINEMKKLQKKIRLPNIKNWTTSAIYKRLFGNVGKDKKSILNMFKRKKKAENYKDITWSLSSVNPGTGSPLTVIDNEANTTFTQQGILDWTNGFHGSFNLNATAIGCDGVTTSPISTKSIVIASRAVTPTDIIVQGGSFLPSCPGSTASTQFYSDSGAGNSVTWSIDNNSAGVINFDTGVLTLNSDFTRAG